MQTPQVFYYLHNGKSSVLESWNHVNMYYSSQNLKNSFKAESEIRTSLNVQNKNENMTFFVLFYICLYLKFLYCILADLYVKVAKFSEIKVLINKPFLLEKCKQSCVDVC